MNKRKCKKGAISLLVVVILLIAAIISSGVVDLMSKIFMISEIQGILDTSGVAALTFAVEEKRWRNEELVIDETKAISKLYELVNDAIVAGPDKTLKQFQVTANIDVRRNSDIGISDGMKNRDQYFLISTARARYNASPFIDRVVVASFSFINFLSGDTEMTVKHNGSVGDGLSEIVVRSVTRLVYR